VQWKWPRNKCLVYHKIIFSIWNRCTITESSVVLKCFSSSNAFVEPGVKSLTSSVYETGNFGERVCYFLVFANINMEADDFEFSPVSSHFVCRNLCGKC
jgi:hypothetical protein